MRVFTVIQFVTKHLLHQAERINVAFQPQKQTLHSNLFCCSLARNVDGPCQHTSSQVVKVDQLTGS